MNHILITGTSGFIGNAIYLHLKPNFFISSIAGRENFIQKLQEINPAPSLIIHCGFEVNFSREKSSYLRNVETTNALIKYAQKNHSKLIFLSAAGALGVSLEPELRSEIHFNSTDDIFLNYLDSSYIQAKIDSEKLIRKSNIPTTILYLTTVYGKGMNPYALKSLNSKVLPPGGTSFLSLSDLLNAIEKVIANPISDSFVINSGNATYYDLAASIGNHQAYTLPRLTKRLLPMLKLFLPAILLSSFGYKYYDAKKFKSSYRWIPTDSFSKILLECNLKK